MAGLQFPGRPGQRKVKNDEKSASDDCKMKVDSCVSVHNEIEIGLKTFYELFGYSDEEEDFEGFTVQDQVQAEAVYARTLKIKSAIQQYIERNQEPTSSGASDGKIFSSSESDTSTAAFVRRRRGISNFGNEDKNLQLQRKTVCKSKSDSKMTLASSSQAALESQAIPEIKQLSASSKRRRISPPSSSGTQAVSEQAAQALSDKEISIKPKHSLAVGRKRFILPSMSAHSSCKIIPRRRYIDESEQFSNKIMDKDSYKSRSSLSVSSEAISAMDGESSPDDTPPEDEHSQTYLKKISLLDQPLMVERKRPWKRSLKMKLSEMNSDYPFALKRSTDGSSGTSSGSFKDIIKPDMVNKYAEKMAQKPKEKLLKTLEGTKKLPVRKIQSERAENVSSDIFEDKKTEDKFEKFTAKIEKILKSPWEGRLKNSSKKLSSGIKAQWKSEQQQCSSNQRRAKIILRKARLHIKTRNLRTRQSTKQLPNVTVQDVNIQPFVSKVQSNLPGLSSVEEIDITNQNLSCAPCTSNIVPEPDAYCSVCGSSKLYISVSKSYEQVICETCNGFFESFLKTPKQYYCKDGKCCIDNKDSNPRQASKGRCKACWIKVCIEKLAVSSAIREQLLNYVPRFDAPPHDPLLTVEDDDLLIDDKEVVSCGPRIKHVSRRATVVFGLPRASFADVSDSKELFNLSALPQEEKQKILETVPAEEKPKDSGESDKEYHDREGSRREKTA